MSRPFKMKGSPMQRNFGIGSPAKQTNDAAKNLLKAVPNEDAYNKLSDINKGGFDVAAKKAGLPTKKAPTKFWAAVAGMAMKKKDEMAENVGTMLNPPKPEEEPKNNVKFSE